MHDLSVKRSRGFNRKVGLGTCLDQLMCKGGSFFVQIGTMIECRAPG